MPRALFVQSLPFVPALAGLALSVRRFGAHDPVGGVTACFAGLLLMVVVVFRLPGSSAPR
jgi:hypothetical protein